MQEEKKEKKVSPEKSEARKWKTGDVVQLTSGATLLTVESYPEDTKPFVRCAYEKLDGTIELIHLHEGSLELAPQEE